MCAGLEQRMGSRKIRAKLFGCGISLSTGKVADTIPEEVFSGIGMQKRF